MLKGRTVSAVILAAGSSTRYGTTDKLYEPLGDRPLLCHSVGAFLEHPAVDEVVLVARADRVEHCKGLFAGEGRISVIFFRNWYGRIGRVRWFSFCRVCVPLSLSAYSVCMPRWYRFFCVTCCHGMARL